MAFAGAECRRVQERKRERERERKIGRERAGKSGRDGVVAGCAGACRKRVCVSLSAWCVCACACVCVRVTGSLNADPDRRVLRAHRGHALSFAGKYQWVSNNNDN